MNPVLRVPELRDAFLEALKEAQKLRSLGGWTLRERKAMLTVVNEERKKGGMTPVTLEDVQRVENLTIGHSDYSSKFALYCAKLALGL